MNLIAFTISAGTYTVKFLIGIAPNGAVVFVSAGYPGNTSDKQITIASGVLDNLETGDGIMADKGFLIDDLLPDGKIATYSNNYRHHQGAPREHNR